jgi:hypothetical protein
MPRLPAPAVIFRNGGAELLRVVQAERQKTEEGRKNAAFGSVFS